MIYTLIVCIKILNFIFIFSNFIALLSFFKLVFVVFAVLFSFISLVLAILIFLNLF